MNDLETINQHIIGIDKTVWFIGTVENRDDPLTLGRCQIRISGLHPDDKTLVPTTDLPWAMPMLPITNSHASSGIGMSPVGPVVGTLVFGLFLDGMDRQQPMMMGTLGGGTGQFAAGVSQALDKLAQGISSVVSEFTSTPLSGSIITRGSNFSRWLLTDLNKSGFKVKDIHCAAIMGNIAGESGILAVAEGHPGKVAPAPNINNHKGGYGFAQWTGPRLTSYLSYCQSNHLDPTSDGANMQFLSYELKTSFSSMIRNLAQGGSHTAAADPKGPHNVDTIEGATHYVLGQFERPKYSNAVTSAPKRVGYATQIWNAMSKSSQPVNGTGKL